MRTLDVGVDGVGTHVGQVVEEWASSEGLMTKHLKRTVGGGIKMILKGSEGALRPAKR